MQLLQQLIETALGNCKADLVLKNASVFNVFTGSFSQGDVAVVGGYIAGVGEYSGHNELDLSGKYLTLVRIVTVSIVVEYFHSVSITILFSTVGVNTVSKNAIASSA